MICHPILECYNFHPFTDAIRMKVNNININLPYRQRPLRSSIEDAIHQIFCDHNPPVHNNLYHEILKKVEKPLFSTVLENTAGNQSQAAILLGISRETLRKKLLQHDLL